MKNIKVLGSGCAKCTKVAEKLQRYIDENEIEAVVKKETSPQALMQYGVMKTPAVVIDDRLVHSGNVPETAEIKTWLAS